MEPGSFQIEVNRNHPLPQPGKVVRGVGEQ